MKFFNILALLLITVFVREVQSTHEWFGQKWLDENYLFKWKTNHLEKVITFRVEVMTKGWVGFGFSKHGKKTEIDMAIGWVDKMGQATFNDFWINHLGDRSLDMSQDWTLLTAEENATHTVLEFSRNLVTCDETKDLQIFENDFEVSNIVFAYSFIDPNDIQTIDEPIVENVFHLNLFERQEIFEPKETDIQIVDHWINITLPPRAQFIKCILLKTNFTTNRQVIKYQAITDPPDNKLKYDHHLNLYDCINVSNVDQYVGTVFTCFDQTERLALIRQKCRVIVAASSYNTVPVTFPDNAGKLMNIESDYFVVEGHFINSLNKEIEAKMSMRFWLTGQIRTHSSTFAGFTATTGFLYSTWGIIVPPKQTIFRTSFIQTTYCMENDQFDEKGIFIFKGLLHSHHVKSGEVRQYRNNQLIRILKINYYDDNYQIYRNIKSPFNLRKSDKLVVFCDYSSINETKSYTSPHEHCMFVTFYYPALNLKDESFYHSRIPYKTMLKITGLEQIDGYDSELYDNIIIRKPVKYNNTKLIDFISENKYKVNDPKELEELLISSDMMECCILANKWPHPKPCHLLTKPPGLYRSVMSDRKHNTCPNTKGLNENKVMAKHKTTNDLLEKGLKIGLSLRALIN